MGRQILAAVVGIVVAVLVVGLIEMGSHQIYPPPAGIDFHDQAQVAAMVANLPVGALLFVLLAWALGSLLGAFVAAKISVGNRARPALAVAVLMLAAVAFNLVAFPHPLWMALTGLLLPLPCALLGARWARGSAA
jgi:hypothetical protein